MMAAAPLPQQAGPASEHLRRSLITHHRARQDDIVPGLFLAHFSIAFCRLLREPMGEDEERRSPCHFTFITLLSRREPRRLSIVFWSLPARCLLRDGSSIHEHAARQYSNVAIIHKLADGAPSYSFRAFLSCAMKAQTRAWFTVISLFSKSFTSSAIAASVRLNSSADMISNTLLLRAIHIDRITVTRSALAFRHDVIRDITRSYYFR